MSDMCTADFMARVVEVFDEITETMRMKNADYASKDDPFQNFDLCERIAGIPPEVGIFVRLTDKFQRIGNLLTRLPSVVEEKIDDTIKDAIAYLVILLVRLEQKRK